MDIEPMAEADLAGADRVFRLAFGTAFGLPDPSSFLGDADLIRPRFGADPGNCHVALVGGEVVGSMVVSDRGGVAVLGPLTAHPDRWDRGVGRRLFAAALDGPTARRADALQLFTLEAIPKHLRLYGGFGFAALASIEIMVKPIEAAPAHRSPADASPTLLSRQAPADRATTIAACARLAGTLDDGLDLGGAIRAVAEQGIGDTITVRDEDGTAGFALCHHGPGSEAGTGALGVKFALARAGASRSAAALDDLLGAVEALAVARGARLVQVSRIRAEEGRGHDDSQRDDPACEGLRARGYGTVASGLAMERRRTARARNTPAEALVLDEWR